MLKWFRRIAISVLLVSAIAYFALPGWHRALTPTLFGMHKIAPQIYTDAPEKAKLQQALVSAARSQIKDFFGPLQTYPRYIICTKQICEDRFALKTRGLNLGYHLVLIGEKGVNAMIIAHETAHSELHRTMGPTAIIRPKFPQWFDEGLASHLSNDTRLFVDSNPDWIKAAQNLRDWRNITNADSWQRTYGAAWSLVRRFEQAHGQNALREVVQRVENGENFDTVWHTFELPE